MYKIFFKRLLDFFISLTAIILLSPLLFMLTLIGAVVMKGNPFFVQPRPGKDEKIFNLIKFRSMTNEKDKEGNLLPDRQRLKPYGLFIRNTSLDELPELFNILKGDMAIVGPRPLLIKDMVFMDDTQRSRHSLRPGLTGLAQSKGRNAVPWEKKLEYDIEYLKTISLKMDMAIIRVTIKGLLSMENEEEKGLEITEDYGDYLLMTNRITEEYYKVKIAEAKTITERYYENMAN